MLGQSAEDAHVDTGKLSIEKTDKIPLSLPLLDQGLAKTQKRLLILSRK